jgi:hypothetical protein
MVDQTRARPLFQLTPNCVGCCETVTVPCCSAGAVAYGTKHALTRRDVCVWTPRDAGFLGGCVETRDGDATLQDGTRDAMRKARQLASAMALLGVVLELRGVRVW